MSSCIENGVLVQCDECIVKLLRCLEGKKHFAIKENLTGEDEGRNLLLEFIIWTLYRLYDCDKAPSASREKVTKKLIEHGQFSKGQIDEIFEKYSYESTYYTEEFFEQHPEITFESASEARISCLWSSAEYPLPSEKKYNFSHSGCELIISLGLCPIDVKVFECPSCGMEITNTPDNVTRDSHDLVCPTCTNQKKNEFDTKGIIISGNPKHHGSWGNLKPEFVYTGTDYFIVLHKDCEKSTRPDGKGVMLVNGLWHDTIEGHRDRVVLGLECMDCGAKNALKPFTKEDRIPFLNVHKEEILKLIEKGEYEKLEFKPYLNVPPDGYQLSGNQKYKIAKSIAGFLNSEGGTLLIGVSNTGNILGIENEYSNDESSLNRDNFSLKLFSILESYIRKEILTKHLKISFHEIYGKDICCVEVIKSPKPIYLQSGQFFIRFFGSTPYLTKSQTEEYIKIHWGNIIEDN